MTEAVIDGVDIVIRVPIASLPQVIEGSWATGNLDVRYKITDLDEFAKDLTIELNREEEDGSTPVHRMFDKAINEAIESGTQGVDEHKQQED